MGSERLRRAIDKDERLCIGLISGTSVDAAEAALCRIRGSGAQVKLELVAHVSVPFDAALRGRVIGLQSVAQLSALNFELGEAFASAALAVVGEAGLRTEDIDVIGSHGQTVSHLPPGDGVRVPSTLQIGEPSIIAERTGIPVVADFRTRDVAAGGQGAPLVPYFDWALFRKAGATRALQNLGGIGNVSVVGDRLEDTIAFDTGPANMVLDALAARVTDNVLSYDRDGTLSARGRVIPELLEELLRHSFFSLPPPKSAGREQFGQDFALRMLAAHSERPYDVIATAVELTVEATARAYEQWVIPGAPNLEGIYVSGGGSRNPNIMAGLTRRLAPIPVRPLSALGFPEAAKEAACFALLASECLSGVAQNVPSATGARHPVVMGKMVP